MKRPIVAAGAVVGATVVFVAGMSAGYALRPDSGAHVLARTADEWAALGTWSAVVIAVVAAVIALDQSLEARRLRIEQAQPYLVAFLEQNPNSPTIVEFVVRNFGTTAARDVRVSAEPHLRRTDGAGVEDVWIPDAIPLLAPQQEWRTFWDSGMQRSSHAVLRDEDCHDVTVTYAGVDRTPRQETRSIVDWGAYSGRMYMNEKTIHHAAESLDKIRRTIERWRESPSRGLTVYVRDGDARDVRQSQELQRRKARLEELNQGPPNGEDADSVGDDT